MWWFKDGKWLCICRFWGALEVYISERMHKKRTWRLDNYIFYSPISLLCKPNSFQISTSIFNENYIISFFIFKKQEHRLCFSVENKVINKQFHFNLYGVVLSLDQMHIPWFSMVSYFGSWFSRFTSIYKHCYRCWLLHTH